MNILHIYSKNNELIHKHVQLLVEGLRQSANVQVADNAKSFYQQARDMQADIIHVHGVNQMVQTKALRCAQKMNIRYVLTLHGQLQPFALEQLPPQQRAAMLLYQRDFIQSAYSIITFGKMESSSFQKLGWNPRIEEIRNAVIIAIQPLISIGEAIGNIVTEFFDWADIPGIINNVGTLLAELVHVLFDFIDIPGKIHWFADFIGDITGWNAAMDEAAKQTQETGEKVSIFDIWLQNLMKNPVIKFFADLAGVTDPEQKRKIIGRDFVEVFNAEAKKITDAKWLAQGTIYPDRIESLNITGKVIKSHHNVGGLPKEMHLQLCEPLKWLFKDEVRRVGRQLGMPEHLITRHPFPGPGLAVRILGDITPEKVRILQDADDIYIRGLRDYKVKLSGEEARKVLAAGVPAQMQDGEIEVSLYDQIWQAGAILLSTVRSVGVMGDERTYEHPVALRAVTSTDAMTADWAHLPYEFMAKVSNEIINKVRGVNRVCYDISSKPPATIEWE